MGNSPILLFGVHCHQPVGNFERVMEYACQRAYLPFLEVIRDYPLPFAVHYSGPLMEFLEAKGSPIIDLIGELVERGQAEVVVSGFYEPILPAIPSWDRVGQIEMAVEKAKGLWGAEPKGLWLTERVWEPQILKELVAAGIEYMVVDDHHLLCAGVERESIHGHFLTEEGGETLSVFPISKPLRYLIPFQKMERVKAYLDKLPKGVAYTLFDDGEKFGLWPGTYDWVYRRGWLRRFLDHLCQMDLRVMGFHQYLSTHRPTGRVYLPTASYPEMGEWALSPRYALELARLKRGLEREGDGVEVFLRGGIWRNFLVRYPESNWLHKRMLQVSRWVRKIPNSLQKEEARGHLYRSQCNDAYWHGVFGGLYAPHLRRALWNSLLSAQRLCSVNTGEMGVVEEEDLDCDGVKEGVMHNRHLFTAFTPKGGAMAELSVLDWGECVTNVLTRRPEAYHLEMASASRGGSGVPSIHQLEDSSPAGITYDAYQKLSFLDHIMLGLTKKGLEHGVLNEPVCLWDVPYQMVLGRDHLQLSCEALWDDLSVAVSKRFSLSKRRLAVHYQVGMNGSVSDQQQLRFGVELNLILPSERFGDIKAVSATRGERHIPVVKGGVERGCSQVILRDPLWRGYLRLVFSDEADLFVTANTSVSKSEKGFDRVYQGNTLLFSLGFDKGEREFWIEMELFEEKGGNSV